MRVRKTEAGLLVGAPAKLNLFLQVLAKRPDGFHEIETLMCPIDLADTLTFCPRQDATLDFTWEFAGPPHTPGTELPPAADNLVVRALELVRRRHAVTQGAQVHLIKRIPLEAGLAGGSSNAAAALVAANLGWKLGLAREELHALAAELGSDVPFFLHEGPAICRGRGERIEPLAVRGQMHAVVIKPPEGLSTAAVYRACRPSERPHGAGPLVDALRCGRWDQVAQRMHNDLQAPAAQISPWIERIQEALGHQDVVARQMTGSGSACFAVCRNAEQARAVAGRLRARQWGTVRVVRMIC